MERRQEPLPGNISYKIEATNYQNSEGRNILYLRKEIRENLLSAVASKVKDQKLPKQGN